MKSVNTLDRRVLYELDLNCRQSNTTIAKKLRTSKDVVNYRISKLEREGVIDGYRAIIDLSKLGYFTFRVYLKLQDTDKELEEKIIKELHAMKEVWWVGRLGGGFDIAFAFWTRSHRSFYSFWTRFLEKYRRYVHHERVSTFVEYIHFRRAYLVGSEEDKLALPEIVGGGEPVEYDETDWRILSLMASDARVPLLKLAQETDLTPMAVHYRIRNLEKKRVILGYRALINFSKLGYEYYKVDMVLEDMTGIKKIERFCHAHPNIVYIDRTIGGSDIEFDFEVENLETFMKHMDRMKETFKGIIRNFEYFAVMKIYKTLYFPM